MKEKRNKGTKEIQKDRKTERQVEKGKQGKGGTKGRTQERRRQASETTGRIKE